MTCGRQTFATSAGLAAAVRINASASVARTRIEYHTGDRHPVERWGFDTGVAGVWVMPESYRPRRRLSASAPTCDRAAKRATGSVVMGSGGEHWAANGLPIVDRRAH